ncbi:phosphatidylinositol-glycan biosynthesis class X protein isoform X1 [Thamnophis elegans]|uniref:phosphatidylinositol-glycan biosynthesis class X protein isoform X1 n=3 Tax=Thamnophis elegans TaxID=35005 RepID=UPI001378FCC4|nr:phosphatidylinositol-glycan biosynthesis class X protein isoform X1 [Thamnophis elegans]
MATIWSRQEFVCRFNLKCTSRRKMCSFNWNILSFVKLFSLCIMPEFLYALNTCPEIMQQFLKDGFHRDLLIRVHFGVADEGLESCRLAIRVHLPRGLYVDPYELKSLQQHNITEALVIADEVDLEVPEYLATDSSVLVYMRPDPKCTTCFKALLPLHCRYYRPSESNGKIPVVLQNPEIMIHCQKSFFSVNCLKETEIEAPCPQNNQDVCYWKSMKYKMLSKELELQVPVGLKHHLALVCAITLITTGLCSSFILSALCRYGPIYCSM